MRGDGSVFQRGDVWYIRFRRHGKETRMSCGREVITKTQAKAVLRAEWQKAQTAAYVAPDQRKVTVGELVADLLPHYRAQDQQLRYRDCEAHWRLHLQPVFDTVRAADLGTSLLNDHRAARIAEGATQTSVNRELQTLRRAYKLAAESEPPKVARVPRFKLPKEDNARKRFYDAHEVERLQRAAGDHSLWCKVFVEMAYIYGWRRGELLALRVGDVNLADRCVRLETSKNGEAREVPITQSLFVLLSALVAGRTGHEHLFPREWHVRKAWKAITTAAGVPDAHLHDWRRTSARTKRAAGVPTQIVMELQGWKSESMFRRYAIVDTQDKLEALEKVESRKSPEVVSVAPLTVHAISN
jgi:integrase